MTLIVTSLRDDDLLVTADGRSRTMFDGRVTGMIDNYQKIFPLPGQPLAIFQHGENWLAGQPVQTFLAPLIARWVTGDRTIEAIAEELRLYADPHVRLRLDELGVNAAGCGLCVVGFDRSGVCDRGGVFNDGLQRGSNGYSGPKMIELYWQPERSRDSHKLNAVEGGSTCEQRQWRATSVVPSGDGQRLIASVDWRQIADRSINDVRPYHRSLFEQAIGTDEHVDTALAEPVAHEPCSVGGHVHELQITRDGWTWTIAPM